MRAFADVEMQRTVMMFRPTRDVIYLAIIKRLTRFRFSIIARIATRVHFHGFIIDISCWQVG